MRFAFLAIASVCVLFSAGADAQSVEKDLAGTSWSRLKAFQTFDMVTPEQRQTLQNCKIPTMSFEMQGGVLVKRKNTNGNADKRAFGNASATSDANGKLFSMHWKDVTGRPDEVFRLTPDGESLVEESSITGISYVKCHTVESQIPEPSTGGGAN